MNKDQERRLRIMGSSSVVGGDIRAALAHIEQLERDLAAAREGRVFGR